MTHKAIRYTAYKMFRDFGGLLAVTIRFTALTIGSTQGYSFTNSIIKKLYSAQDDDPSPDNQANQKDEDKNAVAEEEENDGQVLGLSDSVRLL